MTNTWKPIDEDAKTYDHVLMEFVSTDPNKPAICWATWDILLDNWTMTHLAGSSLIPVQETGECQPIRYMVVEGYEQPNSRTDIVLRLRQAEQDAQKKNPGD